MLIEGENTGEESLREAERFIINDEDFERFVHRHKDLPCLVPESNQKVIMLIVHTLWKAIYLLFGIRSPNADGLQQNAIIQVLFSFATRKLFLMGIC